MALQFPSNTLQGPGSLRAAAATGSPGALTQVGAQAAGAAQARTTQGIQRQTQALAQEAQGALEDAQEEVRAKVGAVKQAITKQSRDLSAALSRQGAATEAELFNDNLRFERDELGLAVWNERQLADYAATQAKSQEQLMAYEQQVAQTLERKQAVLRQALEVIRQTETQAFESEQQGLNMEQTRRIALAKKKLEDDLARLQAEAANSAAIWGGVTAAGGAIATVFPAAGLVVAGVGALGGTQSAKESNDQVSQRRQQGTGL